MLSGYTSHSSLKLAKISNNVFFFFLPTKQKRCVEKIWCEPVSDLRSILDTCPVTLGFFLFRSQNKKSWKTSSGGTRKNFSHSLNCCFSQGNVLEIVIINTVQGSAAYQVDTLLPWFIPWGYGMGIVWSRSGVWVAYGMTWTQPSVTSELRPGAGLCVVFSTPSPLLSTCLKCSGRCDFSSPWSALT